MCLRYCPEQTKQRGVRCRTPMVTPRKKTASPHVGTGAVLGLLAIAGGMMVLGTGCVVHRRPAPVVVAQPVPAPAPAPVQVAPVQAPVAVQGEIYVGTPPPAPMVETRVVAPGPGFSWVSGYWDWDGLGWYWVSGYWAQPPAVGFVYVGPTVVRTGTRWVYRRGHWWDRRTRVRNYRYVTNRAWRTYPRHAPRAVSSRRYVAGPSGTAYRRSVTTAPGRVTTVRSRAVPVRGHPQEGLSWPQHRAVSGP